MSATGNTDLTPEEQDFYEDKFGVRYVGVQWQPGQASRRERRERKFKPKRNRDQLGYLEFQGKAVKRKGH